MRGSGRTTRMLREAKRLADKGKRVAVVAVNQAHANTLRRLIDDPDACLYSPRIEIITYQSSGFEWYPEPHRIGFDREHSAVLVDHCAAENEEQDLLAKLRVIQRLAGRFDDPA